LNWRRRDEQVHLRPSLPFLGNPKDHREWVAECDRRQTREKVGVLRFIPVRGELVRRTDINRPTVD
jgi:hypothetical protein